MNKLKTRGKKAGAGRVKRQKNAVFGKNDEKRQKKGDTAGKGGLPEAAVEVSRGKNRRFGDAFLSPRSYYSRSSGVLQEVKK